MQLILLKRLINNFKKILKIFQEKMMKLGFTYEENFIFLLSVYTYIGNVNIQREILHNMRVDSIFAFSL